MNDRKTPSMETAGSLTPELEGAPHSISHDRHPSATPRPKTPPEGGLSHRK